MRFSELLTTFREKRNISKFELAKSIGKTDSYIRKPEHASYTPPQYEVCQNIANKLNLNEEEKISFFKQAFLERIKSEKDFFPECGVKVNPFSGASYGKRIDFDMLILALEIDL